MAPRSSLLLLPVVLVLSVCLLVVLPKGAWAQEGADARYAAAMDMVNAGRYREAVGELTEAIAISPENIFFCNRGIILIRLKEFSEAIDDLKSCRDTFKGEEEELAVLDAQYQAVTTAHRGLAASARGLAQGIILARTQPTAPPQVTPPAATDGVRDTVPQDAGWGAKEYGFLSLIVGGALLGSALTVDLLSSEVKDDFIQASSQGSPQDYEDAKASVEARQHAFYALGIAGSAMALTGLSLVLWDVLSADAAGVSVGVGPGSMAVGWRF